MAKSFFEVLSQPMTWSAYNDVRLYGRCLNYAALRST
jgi:hypothetical protein